MKSSFLSTAFITFLSANPHPAHSSEEFFLADIASKNPAVLSVTQKPQGAVCKILENGNKVYILPIRQKLPATDAFFSLNKKSIEGLKNAPKC